MCFIGVLLSQSGLESIKERLWQETVQRYGVKEEFVKAEADTMREVLAELTRRYTHSPIDHDACMYAV